MTRTRSVFFKFATVMLIGVTMYEAWVHERFQDPAITNEREASTAQLVESYEEKVFSFQGKILVGIIDFLQDQKKQHPEQGQTVDSVLQGLNEALETALTAAAESVGETADTNSSGETAVPASHAPMLNIKELILVSYLRLPKTKAHLCTKVSDHATEEDRTENLLELVLRLCPAKETKTAPAGKGAGEPAIQGYSEQEQAVLREQLEWFGELLIYQTLPEGAEKAALEQTVLVPARKSFQGFFKGMIIALLIFTASIILCTIAIAKLILGSFVRGFSKAGMESEYCLEIFCLYLAGMLFLSKLIHLLAWMDVKVHFLLANIAGVSSLLVVLLWPVASGKRFADVRERIGLKFGNIRKLFADIFLGPVTYIAAAVPVFLLLLLYSALLSYLKIQPGTGAHPIVPILTRSNDPKTLVLVVLTAVVLAPLVEEIMFRGALYSWLRDRMGAFASIITSSLLFASLHPQGAVGLVPLTCIGIVLALLREWRGTLIAPMLAHASFNAGTLYLVLLLFK